MKVLFMLLIVTLSVHSQEAVHQQRLPNESLEQAIKRSTAKVPKNFLLRENPINKKVLVKDINYSLVPKVTRYDELMYLFYLVRDSRFLNDPRKTRFARRISWLYPDDGCYARAAMTGIKLENEHEIRPVKIFAFGDLSLKTRYEISGMVYWWYHVAVAVNYMGNIYVLDPAIKSDGPILVQDWYNAMGSEQSLQGVVCNEYTYHPFDYCYQATKTSDINALRDQEHYLSLEWDRMGYLSLDPTEILGDNPPWAD